MKLLLNQCAAILLVCLGLFIGANAGAMEPYTHTTTPGNLSGHMTRLDHPNLNGQPDQLLFVTPQLGIYNPHPIGVWYEQETGRWTIYNEDREKMPEGAKFNVVTVSPDAKNAFTLTTSPQNTIDYYMIFSHPVSDNNPDARVMITPNWTETYVTSPLGVWYDGERWSIYRQDKVPLEPGARFNVLVVDDGESIIDGQQPYKVDASKHQVNYGNTRRGVSDMDYTDPEDVIFLTHNWGQKGPYNVDNPAVGYNGKRWGMTNQGDGKLENRSEFNTFTFAPIKQKVVQQAKPVDRRMGWLSVANNSSANARFTLTYSLDGSQGIATSGDMPPKAVKRFDVPKRATNLNLSGEVSQDGVTNTIADQSFAQIPDKAYEITGGVSNIKWSKAE